MKWGLNEVSVRFGEHVALDSVTLEVSPGEIAMVVGGDGAGKTTLCRALVGLVPVSDGVVTRPSSVSLQPETSGVWGDLSVGENLEFVAGAYRLDGVATRSRVQELLDVTGLGNARDRLARHLSGGMRQKLGVAMAVLSKPDLVVLDEPTTGLDPVSRIDLWAFISLATSEGRAVVVTTTYVDEAQRASKVLALDAGRVLAEGTVHDVLTSMPGALWETAGSHGWCSWRRGGSWRTWHQDGAVPQDGRRIAPDLADVITVAAITREVGS